MSVRLLHSADLHLDAPLRALAMRDPELRERVATASRGALERLVRHCIDHDVKALLLAGDTFDRTVQSVNTLAHFARQMERLDEAGVAVFMIYGNHDHANPATGRLPLPANVTIFGPEGGSAEIKGLGAQGPIHVHGLSYEGRDAPGSLVGRYPAPARSALNIGLLHTSLAGSAAHDPYAPCTPEELVAHGYDYWALGHIHGRTIHARGPWVVMPGAPQGRHINETGMKSVSEIVIRDGAIDEVNAVPTAEVVFETVEVAIGADDVVDFARLARRAVEACGEAALHLDQVLVVRIRVTGEAATLRALRHHEELWRERIHEGVRELEWAWVEGLEFVTTARASGPMDEGPVGEIVGAMRAAAPREATHHRLRAILEESLDLLAPSERRALVPDEAALDAMVEAMAHEAIEAVSATLAGTPEAEG
ncbi:metallophosphoesterase family protein [Pararhizobium mangrovi]|uniref:DNA repair exonuclease n=1 Tax=Pararhizobium mangrovi TaxID=2590452 RepID=A0A506U4E2_9HYPH|nr:DNA repair exonuclease [Pararhizobium mangrovi]TPW28680.1 DNA repair exonuclease [Pararhizobium mangrovi]